MAFVNEVVSDSDIDKYGLPFEKGSGRYWTRDAARNMYLWGGKGGNPAFGEEIRGYFHLFLDHLLLQFILIPGEGSMSFSDSPFVVHWESVYSVNPSDLHGLQREYVYSVLRDALKVYGHDGGLNHYAPTRVIKFGF